MQPYILITKTKFKKPFKVQHKGKNGEQLGNPQKYTRKENAFKNIRKYIDLFFGEKCLVDDKTKGESYKFWYYPDGTRSVYE